MSANERVYQIGQTLVTVAIGASTLQIIPPRGCQTMALWYQSGGSLAIVNQAGAASTTGNVLGVTERVSFNGPATFFLAAGGTPAVAGILFGYSQGFSMQP